MCESEIVCVRECECVGAPLMMFRRSIYGSLRSVVVARHASCGRGHSKSNFFCTNSLCHRLHNRQSRSPTTSLLFSLRVVKKSNKRLTR